ncbi:hypothetical protein BDV26DRAFT_296048 [Aspergillus bertholletiae]|uniref:Xylanolytic transcriptional activator regulatory domain-containing protein n=1 Tax=Aspergillus bertholletiae TaxID=1226010 RepID=A0A5N7AX87_9EURO|nr:hypothetical protein BDV26DRAFT_296048 [Aspergillus bertholletiae]
MRPRVSRIAGLSERLSTLEHFISNPPAAAPPTAPGTGHDPRQQGYQSNTKLDHTVTLQSPHSGSWNTQTPQGGINPQRAAEPPVSVESAPPHSAREARRFIQGELQRNDHLSPNKRTVLEDALLLVNRLSTTAETRPPLGTKKKAPEDRDPSHTDGFAVETYFMMSQDMTHQHSPGKHFYWPDHVSVKGLEHMSLSLAEGKLDGQTAVHYRVCVYVKAIFFLARIRQPNLTPRLRTHIKITHNKYMLAASQALDQINVVESHSISLVQALLSGALLHQMQGNLTKAWTLTAFAAQLLVTMDYHTVTEDTPIRNQEEEDARCCLFSCHYLDKTLSMLLLRPPSLPRLRIRPTLLFPFEEGASLGMVAKTMAELAEVQEAVLEILHGHPGLSDPTDTTTKLDMIIQDLVSMKNVIDERRVNSKLEIQMEWVATEFRYFSILTHLLHYRSGWRNEPYKREECVEHARQALDALGRLQKIINVERAFMASYPIFLSWTILFFPMTPFYILFCNVVATSCLEDFHLMRDITKGLHLFVDHNPALARLYYLFTTFLTLCSPLLEGQVDDTDTLPVHSPVANASEIRPTDKPNAAISPIDADNHMYGNSAYMGVIGDTRPTDPTTRSDAFSWWNNAQMWELYSAQPSLEWVDAEITTADPGDYQ